MCCSNTPQVYSTAYSPLPLQFNMEQIYSKRIQFHIDAATLLPSAKRAGKAPVRPDAYVSVQIVRDLSDADRPRAATGRTLQTTAVKGEMTNPRWEQNLEYMDLSGQPAVVFEIMQRSGRLGRRSSFSVAKTEPYPLSTLLAMQGGNAFDRNIELPLHSPPLPAASDEAATAGILSVNIRELATSHTAHENVKEAARRSQEIRRLSEDNIQVDPGTNEDNALPKRSVRWAA